MFGWSVAPISSDSFPFLTFRNVWSIAALSLQVLPFHILLSWTTSSLRSGASAVLLLFERSRTREGSSCAPNAGRPLVLCASIFFVFFLAHRCESATVRSLPMFSRGCLIPLQFRSEVLFPCSSSSERALYLFPSLIRCF